MSFKSPKGKLPYMESVARCYEALDLPYGAPMEQVNRRWRDYLNKCHPDRHAENPTILPDAFKLTAILTWAHGEILAAWQVFGATASRLPYSRELAECYAALDLPYGAPMAEVTRRWREYLKKCHPDRHANAPDKLPDANKLTRLLTQAYETIKEAWQSHDTQV
ncbi:MAG: J domain-containing protein [Thermodesulfobacteriota bacterium]